MRVTVEKEWDHISQRRYRCIHETTLDKHGKPVAIWAGAWYYTGIVSLFVEGDYYEQE